MGVGQGVVLGTLRDDPQRGIMLEAIQKANMRAWSKGFWQKQIDTSSAAKCVKNEFGVDECRLAGTGPEWTKPYCPVGSTSGPLRPLPRFARSEFFAF